MPPSAENVGAYTDNNTQRGEPSEKFIWLERNERVGRSDRYDGERNFRDGRYENIFPKAVAYDSERIADFRRHRETHEKCRKECRMRGKICFIFTQF